MANERAPVVEISQTGRGGRFIYREGDRAIPFDWEFAMSPAIALAWGPPRGEWTTRFPWAADRQSAIYEFACADVVRQKAAGGGFEFDLDTGEITIYDASGERARRKAVG